MRTVRRHFGFATIGLAAASIIAATGVCLGTASSASAAGPRSQVCAHGATVKAPPYYVNNNDWGYKSGSGQQCSWLNSQHGATISWGTCWNWADQPNPNSVKAYGSVVDGWHWGFQMPGTGLPIQLGSAKQVTGSWTFKISQSRPSTIDVAYDNWFTTTPNPTWQTSPADELMVWLNSTGGAGPIGTVFQRNVNLDGTTWTLYKGQIVNRSGNKITSSWNVFSFIRNVKVTSSTNNLTGFARYLVGQHQMSNSTYFSGVEAGTEDFRGTGELDSSAFSVTVR